MARLALTVSYDGTDFAGSQVQPGERTVQGEVERPLAELFGAAERTVFAGRTDRGVHAAGQVVGCSDRRPDLAESTLRAERTAGLPAAVGVLGVDSRPEGFRAWYVVRRREYRYGTWPGARRPLARRLVWQRAGRLDAEAADAAA